MPALQTALFLLIGTSFALTPSFLILPFLIFVRSRYHLLLIAASFLNTSFIIKAPSLPPEGVKGAILVKPQQATSGRFGQGYKIKGNIQATFECQNIRGVPVTIYAKSPMPLNKTYWVFGTLKQTALFRYVLYLEHFEEAKNNTIISLRQSIKELAERYIQKKISEEKAAAFLTGVTTGTFNDEEMQASFARFGLQHIMAISGFHFSIITAIAAAFLKRLLPARSAACFLICALTLYFLFLGNGPSILRAYLSAIITLAATVLGRKQHALNAVGAAASISLVIYPLSYLHIGFQFSYLATLSILLFYPHFQSLLASLFPTRDARVLAQMNRLEQHIYCLVMFLRETIALTLAVNLATLPLMLYSFGSFPLLGLIYNLFFPFLVSISIALLLAALLTFPLPFVCDFIHSCNTIFTSSLLDFTFHLPMSLDSSCTYLLSKEALLLFLFLLLFVVKKSIGINFSFSLYPEPFISKSLWRSI